MALYRLLDHELEEIMHPFKPHFNIPELNRPHAISGATKAQPNQVITMANWLYGGHDKYNTIQR